MIGAYFISPFIVDYARPFINPYAFPNLSGGKTDVLMKQIHKIFGRSVGWMIFKAPWVGLHVTSSDPGGTLFEFEYHPCK